MSDSDDHGPDVDDMLEAAYGGGNNSSDRPERDGKARRAGSTSSKKVEGANGKGASPEPRNGHRRGESVEKRASRSRSPASPVKSLKKRRRSGSRDEPRRRSSRSGSPGGARRSSVEKSRASRRAATPSGDNSDVDRDSRRRRVSKSRSPSKSRSRDRGERRRERDVRRRSPSPVRRRSPSPVRRRSRSRDRYDRRDRYDGRRDGGRGGGGYGRRSSPPYRGGGGYGGGRGGGGGRARASIERARDSRERSDSPTLPAEERDQRTVFAMQLAQTINAKDLEKFFSSVGRVRDVRLIVDSKTRRSKGIAYIEFYELEAVPLALGLHGQKLKNCPMIIQPTHAEKNRAAMAAAAGAVAQKGPMRLYVGSLHFNITEDMLQEIFEPFGKIDSLQLMMDTETARSRGYAFITFRDVADAKRAMEQLNGFELAGRAMKIGHVTDRSEAGAAAGLSLDNDELDRAGFDLGPTGRQQLMAKLAEGTGMKMPTAMIPQPAPVPTPAPTVAAPIATQCFMLSNMFNPATETDPDWDKDLAMEIAEECSQYGGVVHVKVDKTSTEGNVYVKSVSISAASLAVQSLHGRYFAGKMITANYIPTMNYHQLFPEAMKAMIPLSG